MNTFQRTLKTRIVISYILFFLIVRFFEHVTPSGLLSPPLALVQMDVTYWGYQLAGISDLIVHNQAGAWLFDMLLFLTGFLSLIFPLNRPVIISFTIALFLYVISFNCFAMHHTHMLTGFMIILFPFWVSDIRKTFLLWQGIRYYTCLIYAMAFIWKVFITKSFFNLHQGIGIFKVNLADYLYHNPETFMSAFYRFCIRESWILNLGCIIIVLLEGLMIIGFFTKKLDKILIWVPVLIHAATYLFVDVFFGEMLVLNFAFLSLQQIDQIGKRFVILSKPFTLRPVAEVR